MKIDSHDNGYSKSEFIMIKKSNKNSSIFLLLFQKN